MTLDEFTAYLVAALKDEMIARVEQTQNAITVTFLDGVQRIITIS